MRRGISCVSTLFLSAFFLIGSQAPMSEAVTLSDPNLLQLLEVPREPGVAPRFRPNRLSIGIFGGLQEFTVLSGRLKKEEEVGQKLVWGDLEFMHKEKYGFGVLVGKSYGDVSTTAVEGHFNWAFYQVVGENFAFQTLLGVGLSHSDSTVSDELLDTGNFWETPGPFGFITGKKNQRAIVLAPSLSLEPSLSITRHFTVGGLAATAFGVPLVGTRISVNLFEYFSFNFHYYSVIGGFVGVSFNIPF